jgi:hypothetical protein
MLRLDLSHLAIEPWAVGLGVDVYGLDGVILGAYGGRGVIPSTYRGRLLILALCMGDRTTPTAPTAAHSPKPPRPHSLCHASLRYALLA